MLNLLQDLFGGSQQNTQSTSNPIDMQAQQFKDLRQPFSQALLNLVQQGPPQYNGALAAPITQPEQNIVGQIPNMVGPGTERSGYLNDVLQGKYLNSNPFLDAAIKAAQRPTLEGLQNTLERSLPGRFTIGGQQIQQQSSSPFDTAAAIATRGAANAIGDIATNMSFGNYNQERQQQSQAVGLDQQDVNTTIQGLNAVALPRLIQQVGIQNAIQLHQANVQAILDALRTVAGVTAPAVANQAQSTGVANSTPGIIPGLGNFLGNLTGGKGVQMPT